MAGDLYDLADLDAARPAWSALGACRGIPSAWFFPGTGEATTEALRLCAQCPVRDLCREYAVEHHEVGIWGGTNEHQRARLRRVRRADTERRQREQARKHLPLEAS